MSKLVEEYSLADLVADPLIGLLMQSDGVDRGTVERLFDRVARVRAQGFGAAGGRDENEELLRCAPC